MREDVYRWQMNTRHMLLENCKLKQLCVIVTFKMAQMQTLMVSVRKDVGLLELIAGRNIKWLRRFARQLGSYLQHST